MQQEYSAGLLVNKKEFVLERSVTLHCLSMVTIALYCQCQFFYNVLFWKYEVLLSKQQYEEELVCLGDLVIVRDTHFQAGPMVHLGEITQNST